MIDRSTMSLDRFDGRGYRNWKFRLKSALQIEGIVDALDPKNVGSKGFQSKNQRALGHITRALADSHLHYVMDSEYACEVIESLDAIYAKADQATINNVRRRWQSLKLKSRGNVHEHLCRLTG